MIVKKTYLNPAQAPSTELAEYIRSAFEWALDFKAETQNSIITAEKYFTSKKQAPDLKLLMGGEDGCDDDPCGEAYLNLDILSLKRDTFVTIASDKINQVKKPWDISASPIPFSSDDYEDEVAERIQKIIAENAAFASQGDENLYYEMLKSIAADESGSYEGIREIRNQMFELIRREKKKDANISARTLDEYVSDDMSHSNWDTQLDNFLYHLAGHKFAVMKTPEWVTGYTDVIEDGKAKEKETIKLQHESIHPQNYFCSEDSLWGTEGTFEMDISSISLNELKELQDSHKKGFQKKQIERCIEFFANVEREWLDEDWHLDSDCDENWKGYEHIPVIKYHGKVESEAIKSFVLKKDAKKFKENCTYEMAVWVIHDFVIYAHVDESKVVARPYRVDTYQKKGEHKYDGAGIYDLCITEQTLIDQFAVELLTNAGLAAGGIIAYNVEAIDTEEEVKPEDFRGGSRIPVKHIPVGGDQRPVYEIRFDSHISEFLGLINQFEAKMDEKSQIPSTALGFGAGISKVRSTGVATIDAKRTNMAIVRKLRQIEKNVVKPMVRQIIRYHIYKTKDSRIIDGAIDVNVSGYSEIIRKEDRQENLDLFIQNMIGLQNAVNTMEAQGQNVTGIISLMKRYVTQAGFNPDEFFPEVTVESVTGELVDDGQTEITAPIDGRTKIPEDI